MQRNFSIRAVTQAERSPHPEGPIMSNFQFIYRRSSLRLILAAAGVALSLAAQAQDYPSRPIRIIVPAVAGGGTDLTTRMLAQRWSDKIKQPVVVENVPGAGGNIGGLQAVKAKADGYTLLMSAIGTHIINPSLYKNMGYNPQTDLEPIAPALAFTYLIVSHPSLPVKNGRELIEFAKKNPKKINMGSSGVGSGGHIAGEMFQKQFGVEFTHIPFKGSVVTDLLAGNINLALDGFLVMGPHIKAGKVRGVALLGESRNPNFPDVPTMNELGLPLALGGWVGLFAPAGVPAPVLQKIKETLGGILASKEYQDQVLASGFEIPSAAASSDFKAFVADEYKRWTPVVKSLGVQID